MMNTQLAKSTWPTVAVIAALTVAYGGELAASQDSILLFHASFDSGIDAADTCVGQKEFVPALYDRSPLWRAKGIADWQRSKDYRRFRAAHEEAGRLGGCLSVPRGKGQRFRGSGNVNFRRGTFAFWVNFGRALSTAHSPVFYVGGVCGVRIRYKTINVQVGSVRDALKHIKWEPGRWYHIAIAYDCLQGVRTYVDGKLWPRERWGKPEYTWDTDGRFTDLISLGCSSYKGTGSPIMFDDVRCYSKPLAAEEIARLAGGQPISEQPKTEPATSDELFREHRLAELGWDLPGDYLSVKSGEPICIRKIGIVTSRDVKCWRLGAVDGLPNTRWPGGYQGYAIPNRGLHLGLESGARIDYLTIRGDFHGAIYRGLDIAKPPAEKGILTLTSPGKFLRQKLRIPIVADEISFFGQPREQSDKVDKLGRKFWSSGTVINELSMFRIGDPSPAIVSAEAKPYYLAARAYQPQDKWVNGALRSHYEAQDRVAIELTTVPAGTGVTMPALRHFHLFVPPADAPTPMTGTRLKLFPRTLSESTRLRVQVRDAVDVSRLMLDLDLSLEPPADGPPAADVTIDLQDFIIPAGQPLWITLTPERDLDLRSDDPARASRIELLLRPMDEVRTEHVRNMLSYAKDRFIHVSEPRPWGHVPLRQCGERLLSFRQLDLPLRDLKRNAPDNDKVNSLWTWTHPHEDHDLSWVQPAQFDGAPKWAVHAKECLKRYRAFVLWWVENRQLPNGLFGSNHGDDTDLVNDWLSIGMICDPDGRIGDSVRRIADYCWNEGPIQRGINRRHTDTLHAYEEGVNDQPILAQLHYGNPVYLERLMETTRTVRDELMYELPGGRRFFKACWYGATHVDTEYERGTDILGNALMLHSTLYLAYYSRHPAAVKLLKEWAGTWCEIQTDAFKKSGLDGPFPTRAKYPTGEVVGATNRYITGYGYLDVCLGMYAMTRDERYATPMRTWADRNVFSFKTAEDWIPIRDQSPYREGIIAAANGLDWAPLKPAMGDDSRTRYAYMAWLLTGKKQYVETALASSYRRIAALFPMHTWAEQSADRVAVSKSLVDRLYLGGTPGYRNKLWPTHTVSWSSFSDELAAWVLHTKPESLRVWIYNFEPGPQKGELRVWGLDSGEYDVRFGLDSNEDETIDRAIWQKKLYLARNVPIALELPSRQLLVLEAKQLSRSGSIFELPDLAVVTTDMSYDRDSGKLTFVLHNVGNAAAEDVDVVIRIDGKEAAKHRIPKIEPPLDLVPRTLTLTQVVPADAREVVVEVDPRNMISELWEENNKVERVVP